MTEASCPRGDFMQGTAKLHYVAVRVFRTLLSKGLCSDETEEGEGEGEGDIDGMKVTGRVLCRVWYIARLKVG